MFDGNDSLHQNSLCHFLILAWLDYEGLVSRAIKKSSRSNIHKLRIATQQIEAVLVLVHGLIPIKNFHKLIREFRQARKVTSKLRNLHVELKALDHEVTDHRNAGLLKKRIHENIKYVERESVSLLRKLHLKKQRKMIREIEFNLFCEEEKLEPEKMKAHLIEAIKEKRNEVSQELKQMDPLDFDNLHHFRMNVKRMRYQKEIYDLFYNLKHKDVYELKNIQSELGEILDHIILKADLLRKKSIKLDFNDSKIEQLLRQTTSFLKHSQLQ